MFQTLLGFAIGTAAVTLPSGNYHGLHDGNTTVYYGIPYAKAARFEPPGPVNVSHHGVNATQHGPGCIQFNIPAPFNQGFAALLGNQTVASQSEDCLNLDVYVPDGDHCNLPVLFYTPGGGFLLGASFLYDMRPLVERSSAMGTPFVGVSINYRLGPLGFLNPSNDDDVYNLGLQDQFAAMRWVKHNIRAFGGDPDNLIIMGQSAGAESTMHQLLSSDIPVRGAYMISTASSSPPFLQTVPSNSSELVQSYAGACNCPNETVAESVACLRSVDTSIMVNQSDAWEGSGTGLGGVIQQNVFEQLYHNPPSVPVVISVCRDEGTSSAIGFNSSSDAITTIAIDVLGSALSSTQLLAFEQQMLQAYPNDPAVGCPFDGRNTTYGEPSQFKRMSAIFTDGIYIEAWTEYLQLFPHAWGIMFEVPIPGTAPAYGVQHGSDLEYYFPSISGGGSGSPEEKELQSTLQTAVVRFVASLDPGWPRWSDSRQVLTISATQTVQAAPPYRPGFGVIKKFLRPE